MEKTLIFVPIELFFVPTTTPLVEVILKNWQIMQGKFDLFRESFRSFGSIYKSVRFLESIKILLSRISSKLM